MRSGLVAVLLFFLQATTAPSPASIEGYVVKAGTSTPIARAKVDVSGVDGKSGLQSATTDASGKFSIRNLPAGRYRISASRDGYMPAQLGARSRGGPGAIVTLESRQELKDVVVSLTPMAAISGRVYDRFGDPVVNATVQALRHTYQDGRRILISAGSVATNDLGEYRLYWLTPGQYVISAAPLEPGGPTTIIGGVTRFEIRAPAPSRELPETFLPVYYPGTTDAAAATPIDVSPGANLSGVDLQIVETRAVRVRGLVTNGLTGQPVVGGGAVMLVPRRGTVATGSMQFAASTAAGTFEFRHIAPGSYDLVAKAASITAMLVALAPITISNADIDGLGLVLRPQFAINGRISLENVPSDASISMSGVRVELRREPYTPELLVVVPTLEADGTFTLRGVSPGDYQLKVGMGAVGGYVKSARLGAVDALNPPFHVDAPVSLDIVVSLNAGSMDGVVFDDMQKPFNDATIVLVPDPSRRQRFDLYAVTGSDASGQFHLKNLTPGDYRIFAWQDVPADAWLDPDFLRAYENRGAPVRVTEGSNQNIQVRLIP